MEDNSLVSDFWRDDLDRREVIVSVRCLVFNHERFIRNALDGFIMQRTSFRYEVIVHDDASTDGTQDIIREYANKYPSIIKPILESENQFSKADGSLGRIMDAHMRGKYIAYCEGDDYWTDPLKLQKQVDFLESHPDYSMCFHNAVEHWVDGSHPDRIFASLEKRDYNYRELVVGWIVPTASAIVRNNIFKTKLYNTAKNCRNIIFGDILIWLTAAECGKVYCIGDTMSVYRRHPGGITFSKSVNLIKKIIVHRQSLPIVFGEKYKFAAIDSTVRLSLDMCSKAIRKLDIKTFWEYFNISFRYAPTETIKKILTKITNKLIRH